MDKKILRSKTAVTVIGGGPVTKAQLQMALRYAPKLLAADSGADHALRLGVMPDAVVGDLDSLSNKARATIDPARLHRISEQETTDFSKALRSIEAPLILAVGVLGGRVDHELAVMNALVRHAPRCVLLGARDVVFHLPPLLQIKMQRGDRFSLFPLASIQAQSTGLEWPLEGLTLAPDAMIGTSNRVSDGAVEIRSPAPGMLCILPRARLAAAIAALATS